MRGHERVYFVAAREQVGAIDAQFVGEMQARDALSNAAEDLHDGGTAIAGLPPDGSSKQVKDRAALPATLVRNDRSSPPMGCLICTKRVTARTVEAVRVQNVQQEVITGLFIEQSIKRKSEHRATSFVTVASGHVTARGTPRSCFTTQPT